MKRIAKCCCEQAGIEVEGEPELNLVCHCDSCKRATGSAFGISVYFKDEQIVRTFGETNIGRRKIVQTKGKAGTFVGKE